VREDNLVSKQNLVFGTDDTICVKQHYRGAGNAIPAAEKVYRGSLLVAWKRKQGQK
jgi:hypothetical protein